MLQDFLYLKEKYFSLLNMETDVLIISSDGKFQICFVFSIGNWKTWSLFLFYNIQKGHLFFQWYFKRKCLTTWQICNTNMFQNLEYIFISWWCKLTRCIYWFLCFFFMNNYLKILGYSFIMLYFLFKLSRPSMAFWIKFMHNKTYLYWENL